MHSFQEFLQELRTLLSRDPVFKDADGKSIKQIDGVVVKSPNIQHTDNELGPLNWNDGQLTAEDFNKLAGNSNSVSCRFVAVNLANDKHAIIFGSQMIHVSLMAYLSEVLESVRGSGTDLIGPSDLKLKHKNREGEEVLLSDIPHEFKGFLESGDKSRGNYLGKSYMSKSILLGFVHITKSGDKIHITADKAHANELNKKFAKDNDQYNRDYAEKLAGEFKNSKSLSLGKKAPLDVIKPEWKWLHEMIPNYLDSLQ